MENGTPVTEATPETSTQNDAKKIDELIGQLNDLHYLLNVGFFTGKEADRVAVAKEFLLNFKAHLSNQKKVQVSSL